MSNIVLVLGACGQIGTELTHKLRLAYGNENVIASDINDTNSDIKNNGPFVILDATDRDAVLKTIKKYKINQVYLMAAMLSAVAEKSPQKAWNLNMSSLLLTLELAREKHINSVFWPSSIAAFGPSSPKINTPQLTVMEPTTVYGISKVAGEHWCNYYHEKFGVDVRSVRYPGIISWKTKPGGGTTDYAIEIYFEALKKRKYECFLDKDTLLPMMYMDDAVEATIQIMQTKESSIKVRTSYNLAAMSFTPKELAQEIKKHIPDFKISYKTDFRQKIAESWPKIIDDSQAKKDWGWNPKLNLSEMTKVMLKNIKENKM